MPPSRKLLIVHASSRARRYKFDFSGGVIVPEIRWTLDRLGQQVSYRYGWNTACTKLASTKEWQRSSPERRPFKSRKYFCKNNNKQLNFQMEWLQNWLPPKSGEALLQKEDHFNCANIFVKIILNCLISRWNGSNWLRNWLPTKSGEEVLLQNEDHFDSGNIFVGDKSVSDSFSNISRAIIRPT
ncbi:hypothetical protein CDAR_277891 [Caerostris darwini]|uniref:Uncharacterized protein n=1 Tax=Caerostris darwini TaxID=1538125 RepID=A0AAV4PIS6_9ARAC|nr:hypothetical protein CDAR_277891 [Caerostris darwini]